ncbi:MAG: CRISPR-associated endonuclease Cas2 [Coriobacteriia bacterium]|nr:CRISPR-associated endonuclease Cas2 [Coriobacteriia bacterium]
MTELERRAQSFGRIAGASPSLHKYYVIVMFDISGRKKYSILTKVLKRYCRRIQNSVYDAYLCSADIKEMSLKIENLMASSRFYDKDDRVRIYKMSGLCQGVILGSYPGDELLAENIYI